MLNTDHLRLGQGGRKPLGKLAARLEEVKNPWRQGSTLELSHNEAARLATDALLESGEKDYRRVLTQERELNFLSPLEIRYITENVAKNCPTDSSSNGSNDRDFGEGDAVSELTSGTYFPMMSDEEPPMLELGWPEQPLRYRTSETQIYFQRDKSHNIKDIIRSLINKAKKVIALVMDLFTDVDLLCDLMEASSKRKVPVYILLDEKNLDYFVDMCSALDVQNSHLGNMRIRTVCGDTYCTKSGKKFTGQVQEKFMIIDCEEVIAGSYSFTWLSAQVHSNMMMHFSGHITDSFDREFRCLYADSQIIDCFHNPEDEGLPCFPAYPAMTFPGMAVDFLPDRSRERERLSSENSSSQSSSSMSSVKAAPGMAPTVYKVTQGHEKKEASNAHLSPERRGGGNGEGASGKNSSPPGTRINEANHSSAPERPAIDWTKSNTPDFMRPTVGGTTSKFQALGLYDHKLFQTSPNPVYPSQAQQSPVVENKLAPNKRAPSNPLLNKLTDLFMSPTKEKDSYTFRKSPPHSTAWGGPDLTPSEPESQQIPPVPLSPVGIINRQDKNRMTLGHSKLDLVNHYNQMKSKHVYSRFELKNNN